LSGQQVIEGIRKKATQTKLPHFDETLRASHLVTPLCSLRIVRPGEDRTVRIAQHQLSLALLAEIWRLYWAGSSTRALQGHLLTRGIHLSHVTIWRLILTLSHLVYTFSLRLHPAVGDEWYADEMKVARFWLVLVNDRMTRFTVAAGVILSRSAARLRKVLKVAKMTAGKSPKKFKTDACPGYRKASVGAFGRETVHEFKSKDEVGGLAHTNFEEGSQRPIRARIDAMATFHGTQEETRDLIEGYVTHHNYVAISPAAGNMAPSEACAVPYLGDDPALTLLWNAIGDETSISLRRHTPRQNGKVLLTRWVPVVLKISHFFHRRRRVKSVTNPKFRDTNLLDWCHRVAGV